MVALVDTGATIFCCRWEWYQKWQDHLGVMIKSKGRFFGVGSDPIKIKGLTRPLTLHWDGVGGKCQLRILTDLTEVDVVLGMDVLSQFDVQIDFKKQVARPAREPCSPLEPTKTVGFFLDNPDFTFKGKIPIKEEGVEEVAKGVGRPWYREVHRVWIASARKMKTKDKKEDRKIFQKSSMPWNQVDYKTQLENDLNDIQHKLSQVLGRDLTKSDISFVEATSPVKCIEGGVLVDLCMQRSGKRGSGCDAPNEADKFPKSADGSFEASKGFPTHVTSLLMPPKPPRTEVRLYSWRRKEVCMHIRLLKQIHRKDKEVAAPHPNNKKTMTSLSYSHQKSEGKDQQYSTNTEHSKSETNQLVHGDQYTTNIYKESRAEQREIKFKRPESANCQNSDDVISDGINQGGEVNRLIARKRYTTAKLSFSHTKEFLKATLNIYKQFSIQLAFILAATINLIGNGLSMNLLKLVWIAGLAVVVCQECGNNSNGTLPLAISVLTYAIVAALRESTAAITNISKVLACKKS